MNAKAARAIKTVFYALDVVNQGMQEKQSITVRCMDIEDLEKQAEAIRVEQIKLYELQQAADQLSKEKPKQKEHAKEVAHEDR